MKKSIFILFPFLLASCGETEMNNKKQIDYTKAANVIILSGQSNAEGQSLVSHLPGYFEDNNLPTNLYEVGFEDIKLSYYGKDNSSNKDKKLEGEFVTTKLGYGASALRFGPEMPIAEKLSGKLDKPTYIIKFTYSAAGFFGDPNFTSPSSLRETGQLYLDMVEFITNSLYLITLDGYVPVIRSLVWIQGEADGYSSRAASEYKDNFNDFFNDLKNEIGNFAYNGDKNNIALIDATISKDSIWDYYDIVNRAKKLISQQADNHFLIDTLSTGLDLKLGDNEHGGGDDYHYTVDSTIRLGHEVADILLNNHLLDF